MAVRNAALVALVALLAACEGLQATQSGRTPPPVGAGLTAARVSGR